MTHMSPRLIVILLVLVLSACGSDATDAATDPTPSSDNAPETSEVADLAPSDESSEPTVATDDVVTEEGAGEEAADTTSPDEEGEPDSAATTADDPEQRVFAPLEVDCSTVGQPPVGLQTGTIMSGGIEYKYQWTVPSTYDGTPVPVVLDFHAIGSNGAQQAVFGGWAALAEAEGFLAVQPTGIAVAPDDRASWELPQFDTDERDDVAMVRDLLDHVAANVCIDPARIYSTGMSNGSLFTSVVVCELADFIAAAVSVAGVTHDDSCAPAEPVPYLAFHGTEDTTIPFRGGGETTLDGSDGGEFFEQVMPDEFAEFAQDFGCTESADTQVTESVVLTSYTGCAENVQMGFYTIDGGGHTWPGSVISSALPSLGVTTMEVDATAIAWEFFQQNPPVDG